MIRIFLLFVICLLSTEAFGQYYPNYGLNIFDKKIINPAFVGNDDKHVFATLYRGFIELNNDDFTSGGSPTTILLSYENQISDLKSGFGFTYFSDALGPTTNREYKLSYSYQLPLSSLQNLNFGSGITYQSSMIDFGSYRPIDQDDPLLSEGVETENNLNLDLGIAYLHDDKASISVGVLNLLKHESTFNKRIVNIYGEYKFNVLEPLQFWPSVRAFNYVDDWHAEINGTFIYQDILFAGFRYETASENPYIILGVQISDMFEFGTFIDADFSHLSNSSYLLEFLLRIKIDNE